MLRCNCQTWGWPLIVLTLCAASLGGQTPSWLTDQVKPVETNSSEAVPGYLLGPEDQLEIWVLGLEEISAKSFRIDPAGYLDLPFIGRVRAGGLTVEELQATLRARLDRDFKNPSVSIRITEFGSQPVSVLGAVNNPGVHQLRGRRNLLEVVSLSGGFRKDAGRIVKISRASEWGGISLQSARSDPSGRFFVAEVKLKDLLAATNPPENILIRPHDVITVPSAEMIYVIGAVRKAGAFVLNEQETPSVLQALSMAEGLGSTPAPQRSKVLRQAAGSSQRDEIPIDLNRIIEGKAPDLLLQANDILFVPTSTGKQAALRAVEAVITTGTGIAIWRR